jgi:hypothetical protein
MKKHMPSGCCVMLSVVVLWIIGCSKPQAKWEYSYTTLYTPPIPGIKDTCNPVCEQKLREAGSNGWELCASYTLRHGTVAGVLKRPIR